MKISYNWLRTYLPIENKQIDEATQPQKLSQILTSIGLEVESFELIERPKGGLKGIVIGEVLTCEKHENADKLKVTTVNVGNETLQIVCGAANVAAGQKVVVATVGAVLYPANGESFTIKQAKIRGVESSGMICAEDEIGLGESHDGIMVLPEEVIPGTQAGEYFGSYSDYEIEIGLTPNRMDAMSHLGVAKDVCAYLSHHLNTDVKAKLPYSNNLQTTNDKPIAVSIENTEACERYAGVSISGVAIAKSPQWLIDKLTTIGQKPINNIVDITNYILHETGQPLHAFDADKIKGNAVVVKTLAEGTAFTSLDEKERKLSASDLMICNGNNEGMCIAGVFGGIESGVSDATTNIFLESAWFNPVYIRRTSLKHELRTEAATHFEKGVDISNTVNVLKRAAALILEVAGGKITSEITDIYPHPKPKAEVTVKYHYIKRLSGKNYHPDAVKRILTALGFEIQKESIDELCISVPYNKPDITIPADIVEEIIRIDGLDNIAIPASITITPANDELSYKENLREKIAGYLTGLGFSEILTNSITNSRYYSEAVQNNGVKMLNSLSVELDMMRPSMTETGMEAIAYNINRRNANLKFYEFGKTYGSSDTGKYYEEEHCCLYITGVNHESEWRTKETKQNVLHAKGIALSVIKLAGIVNGNVTVSEDKNSLTITYNKKHIATVFQASAAQQKLFDIKQSVYIVDIHFTNLIAATQKNKTVYKEVSKFPAVQRDLALVLDKKIQYSEIETIINNTKLSKLQNTRLFDVFESDKLGKDKKSMAVNFTFLDEEKTMSDKEIDAMMNKLITNFEKSLQAEIRK